MTDKKFSLSDSINEKNHGNKGQTIFKREKERKNTRNYKRETKQVKSMQKQKGNRVN